MVINNQKHFYFKLFMAIIFSIIAIFWSINLFLPNDLAIINGNYYAWFSFNLLYGIERWVMLYVGELNRENETKESKQKKVKNYQLLFAILITITIIFWLIIIISQFTDNSIIFEKDEVSYWPSFTLGLVILVKKWSMYYEDRKEINIKLGLAFNYIYLLVFMFWFIEMILFLTIDYNGTGASDYYWTISTGAITVIENFGSYFILKAKNI